MKLIFSLTFSILWLNLFAQWESLDIPSTTRYDDVFFIDENVSWAVGGPSTDIYKTTDGGLTWEFKFNANRYLRSIEFATPMLGFADSLQNYFYKSADGGEPWVDISDDVPF